MLPPLSNIRTIRSCIGAIWPRLQCYRSEVYLNGCSLGSSGTANQRIDFLVLRRPLRFPVSERIGSPLSDLSDSPIRELRCRRRFKFSQTKTLILRWISCSLGFSNLELLGCQLVGKCTTSQSTCDLNRVSQCSWELPMILILGPCGNR